MGTTETQTLTETKLNRISWLSAKDVNKRFKGEYGAPQKLDRELR